jgi:hypothetical protein
MSRRGLFAALIVGAVMLALYVALGVWLVEVTR